MASVYDKIRQALEVELNSVADIPDIAWENVDFNPVENESYIRVSVVPLSRNPSSLGDNFQFFYRGYFELMVYTPKNIGPSQADDLADLLMETFDPPKTLTVDDVSVQIRTTEREQGISLPDMPYYYVPVVVSWFCYQ